MKTRKIIVLHIICDDKFYDGVINAFESDKRIVNRSVLVVKTPNYKYSYIKQTEKVELLWNKKMIRDCFHTSSYDVVFFHSLPVEKYLLLKYIPRDKIIVWWSWGFDIYTERKGMRPLIQVDLYKPKTAQLVFESKKSFANRVIDLCRLVKGKIEKSYYYHLRNYVISRVDFFQPVIPLEYQLMKRVDGFKAKEFYYPKSMLSIKSEIDSPKSENGAILIGNSATYTNNHLDIWERIRCYLPNGRNIIIPANYGNIHYSNELELRIQSKDHNICIIKDFMPRDKYFQLINSCSYAVFGVIRQQAMGNINYCLSKGIKVFLYRDSIVYKYLKYNGFMVYAIEDIDESSFKQTLTQEQNHQNVVAYEKILEYEDNVRIKAFDIIIKSCNKV